MRRTAAHRAAIAMSLLAAAGASAEPGLLDPGFGTNGVALVSPTGLDDGAGGVALQPDGKPVVVGYAGLGQTTTGDFALARLLPGGAPDPDFGAGGTVVVSTPTHDTANDVAVLSDGRILVSGTRSVPGNSLDFAVARFLADGTLDATFGTGGFAVFPVGPVQDTCTGIAVQADGRIVLIGSVVSANNADFGVVRLLPDGAFDASFGTGGKVVTPVGASNDYPHGVALRPDGKIVLAGESLVVDTFRFSFARYHPDGTLDPTFGTNGTVLAMPGGSGRAMLLEPDGRITAAGWARLPGETSSDAALVRLLPDGGLDPTFGTGGSVRVPLGPGWDLGFALARQANGKLVVAGSAETAAGAGLVVARFDAAGALDPTFGAGGLTTLPFTVDPTGLPYPDRFTAVLVQPDGRIVAAGGAWVGRTDREFVVARLQGDVVCGDGVVAPGEDCDAGGTPSGDCCSAACRFEPAMTPCTDDGDTCTNDVCDGAAPACTHPRKADGCC